MRKINKIGRVFGRLTVLDIAYTSDGFKAWICRCDCGNVKTIRDSNLLAHLCCTARCLNKKSKDYKRYGARGITVHESWVNSYQSFLDHIGRAPSKRHSVDRIDNNKGYEPFNVRWATTKEQGNNTRYNKPVIDTNTGTFYKSIAEAYQTGSYSCKLSTLYHQLTGRLENKTSLILAK